MSRVRAARLRSAVPAWLALIALALLPTFMRVAAASVPGGWAEVCTAKGMRWLTPEGELSERGPGGQAATAGSHCPLCGAGSALPLPLLPHVVRPGTPAEPVPELGTPSLRPTGPSATPAQPRAPPAPV